MTVVGRLAVIAGLVLIGPAAGVVAAQQPVPPDPTAEEYRQAADEVLAREEFQRPDPTILERIREWVGERLDSVIEELSGGGAGSVVGWIVLVGAAAALAWALTRLGRTVQGDPAVAAATVRIDEGHTPDEWRERAVQAEAEQRWKQAILYRYRALLGDLVRAGVVEDIAGRTTGEYRREVEAARWAAGAPFGEATDLFELAWYADAPTGAAESERFRIAADTTMGAPADSDADRPLVGAR